MSVYNIIQKKILVIFRGEAVQYLWRKQRASTLNRTLFYICENYRFLLSIISHTWFMGPVLKFQNNGASQTSENPHEYK